MGFFVIFYPASWNQGEKFIYQFFKAQVTGKKYSIFVIFFFWKTRKTREIVSLEVGFWKIDKKNDLNMLVYVEFDGDSFF